MEDQVMMKSLAIASVFLLAGALNASAYTSTYIFKDVRSPPWHARSQAAKLADARACGASASDEVSAAAAPAAVQCMATHGWKVARIIPNKNAQVRQAYNRPAAAEERGGAAADDSGYWANYWAAQQNAQAMSDQENAAYTQIGADTEAEGIAQMEAAEQAASQAQMLAADQAQ
jgi:hypothetical protein